MMTREEAFDVLANAATMVPGAHRTSVFAHAGKVLYDEIERLETEAKVMRLILLNLSATWFYGDWKAETPNEVRIEAGMRALGFWPTTEDKIIAARSELEAKP